MFFQFRVRVARQHFTMSIDIYTFTISLDQQLFQVVKVMTSYNDERTWFYSQRYCSWYWSTICFSVSFIKNSHAFQVDLTEFHQQVQPFFSTVVFSEFYHAFDEPSINFRIMETKACSMPCIRSHTTHT